MKITTKKLLEKLNLSESELVISEDSLPENSDLIFLNEYLALAIEEDAALPTVSIEEPIDVGGNVMIASWVITDDSVLDEIVRLVSKENRDLFMASRLRKQTL